MKWNNDRSLLLSRVCVWVFTVLLAALLLTAPWFWNWILWRSSVRMVYIGVTYASGVPAAVVPRRFRISWRSGLSHRR